MNKYQKAFNTIGDTITYYTICKDLALLPSDNEIFDSMDTLRELVDKSDSKHEEITANEMFKNLGYKYNKSRNRNRMIEYCKEDSTSVLFWIKERKFSVSEYCEPKNITVDEFKAIQKQMEELGWM